MEAQARLNSISILQGVDPGASPESDIRVEKLPDQDWNRQWAQSVRPIRIGRRIVIRPSWEPVALQAQDVEIVLDPKQAFGTGHHATTRMLLEWLEDLVHGGESVLDVGAGSGILAMVALRLGRPRPSEWNATLLRWIVHETMPQRTGLGTISSSGAERWRKLTGKASCDRIWFSPISIAGRCCFCAMNWRST